MLLTRSPLSPEPKPRFSLDLHVLSAPPAFVLSQDQTLREENIRPHQPKLSRTVLQSSLMLDLVFPKGDNGFYASRRATFEERRQPTRGLDVTLLSFQRP